MMPTYKDLADRVRTEAKELVPRATLTDRMILQWLTEAIHEYQNETNVVEKEATIDLSTQTTGEYPVPTDFKTMVSIRNNDNASTMPIMTVSRDHMNYLQQAWGTDGTINTGKYYVAVKQGKIVFWPYASLTGTVRVTYKPHLVPYTPDNTVEWTGYGANPAPAMATGRPDGALAPALQGIVNYAKAMVIENTQGAMQANQIQYKKWLNDFERMKDQLAFDDTDYTNQTSAPHYLGPVF